MTKIKTPRLQRSGALRPDLPIEAMVKMKMVAVESEVMGPSTGNALRHELIERVVNNELNIKDIQY